MKGSESTVSTDETMNNRLETAFQGIDEKVSSIHLN